MIKEDYVSYKVAKLLKEKGFDEPCRAYYNMGALKEDITVPRDWSHSNYIDHISAPTLQMAMKWFRDERGVYIQIKRSFNTFLYSALMLKVKDGPELHSIIPSKHETYEEAVEAALKYSLENLI